MKNRLIFFIPLLIMVFFAEAINFYRVNVSWQYDPTAPIKMTHRVVTEGDKTMVFLSVSSLDSLKNWALSYLVQESYESESHREVQPLIDTLYDQPYKALLRLEFLKMEESLLAVRISKPGLFLFYDIGLRNANRSFPDYYPMSDGKPILQKYVSEEPSWSLDAPLYATRYPDSFDRAAPPMAELKTLIPNARPDSSFQISGARGEFQDYYFYFIGKDSLATQGFTLLKVPSYFPKFRKLPELVESLFYITNEAEQKSLIHSSNLKKSFDSFWINTYGSGFKAKSALKKYYDAVEGANRLFTSFMQGWKTDRGMMYIVFGPPDEVYRQDNVEEWFYDDGLAVEFNVISTFFSPRTYSLRRKQSLESAWYDRVASIRRGVYE